MKKRGQITVFIIVGIIILFAIFLFLYVQREKVTEFLTEPLETIPSQYSPVKNFVEGCIENTATQGILLLGMQGGYITIPQWAQADPRASIPLTPDGAIRIPLWYYRDNPRVPTIKSMQNELTTYIGENVGTCLQNFTALADRFSINASNQIEIVTQIGDEAVIITAAYPLSAQLLEEPEARQEITTFVARIPVRLKRMHELAKEILNAENEKAFFENLTINLMAAGPDIPFSNMEFSCQKLQWRKDEVESDIKNLIFYNFPRVGFKNTDHPEPTGTYAQKNFILDMVDNDYSDLQAGVYYSRDWPLDMTVRPSRGNLMSASFGEGNQQYLSFICVNVYHFTYDIIYPLQITIRDDDAFRGAGFAFNFATPIMINHNKPQRANFQVNVLEQVDSGLEFCNGVRDEEHVIYATDRRSFEELRGVNATFTCMNTYECPLGQTDLDAGVYRLRTHLPTFCKPGAIRLEKQGYLPVEEQARGGRNDMYMIPLRTFPFTVVKRPSVNEDLGQEIVLSPDEAAYVFLTLPQYPEYSMYRKFNASEAVPQHPATPELLRTIDIPRDGNLTFDVNIVFVSKNEELLGGFFGNWTPTLDEIEGAQRVVFRVMEKRPRPISETSKGNLIFSLTNGTYQSQLEPYLS